MQIYLGLCSYKVQDSPANSFPYADAGKMQSSALNTRISTKTSSNIHLKQKEKKKKEKTLESTLH